MEEVASIIIHLDCYDAIKCLPDELAGILFKSILCYGSTGELPKIDDKSLLALFNMFKAQRDRDKKNTNRNAKRIERMHAGDILPKARLNGRIPSQAIACRRRRTHA